MNLIIFYQSVKKGISECVGKGKKEETLSRLTSTYNTKKK